MYKEQAMANVARELTASKTKEQASLGTGHCRVNCIESRD
jgi:hypothetical protein